MSRPMFEIACDSPIERRGGVHYRTRDREGQGHSNVRLQRPAAEALSETWQSCRSKDGSRLLGALLLRAVIGLTARRGPLCLDTCVERNGSFHHVLSPTAA